MEKELWIAVFRECNTGDSADVNSCLSFTCPFCNIVRRGFQHRVYPGGVTLASSSALASEALGGEPPRRSTKILMNVRLTYMMVSYGCQRLRCASCSRADTMRKEHSVVSEICPYLTRWTLTFSAGQSD